MGIPYAYPPNAHPYLNVHILLKLETCVIDVSNLDRTHEHNVNIGLEDCVEDLGFTPSMCIHFFVKLLGPCSPY